MKTLLAWAGLVLFIGFYTACSDVRFTKQVDITQYGAGCSQQGDTAVVCEGTETVRGGKIDILFVNDNSVSMSYEQARLAQRFSSFIQLLDSKFIDYRIGVTTTDISSGANPPRAINQNGALQNGNLIGFPSGKSFLTPEEGDVSQRVSAFNAVINRPETLACEKFITDWFKAGKTTSTSGYNSLYLENCPSSDERGIYAANTLLKNNPGSFLRGDADLAVIFLADEDVRSGLYYYNSPGYELDVLDTGKELVRQIQSLFPGKTFGVHAIITKTDSCLQTQNSQTMGAVKGSFGWEYQRAVQEAQSVMASSVSMVSGDICANDYTGQLQQIFQNIEGQLKDSIALGCENPVGLSVTLSTTDPTISHTVVGRTLKFSKKLPAGTTVSYRYSCGI